MTLRSPDNTPRAPDPFVYSTPYQKGPPPFNMTLFFSKNSITCAARTADNRDVVIRLMAIGQDRGEGHRLALSRLATDDNALTGPNHTIPVLDELVHRDMVFAVFPKLDDWALLPWYYSFSEVLDSVTQTVEGIAFCHGRLVAHRDIDRDNILVNFAGGMCQPEETNWSAHDWAPFRSLFPIRYFINDFELAVTFDPDSDPSSRVVTGLPTAGVRPGEYGRDIAPEMLLENPYCPFRADIWQLGKMFRSIFGHLNSLSPPLVELFDAMCSDDPLSRPLASELLERIRGLDISQEMLMAKVPHRP